MDETNLTTNGMGNKMPRKVKKIKRPIKRLTPGNPMNPSSPQRVGISGASQRSNIGANLDELLDSQLNLPALNNARNSTPAPEEPSQPKGNYHRPDRFISDNDLPQPTSFMEQLMVGNLFTAKGVIVVSVLVFIVGLLFAKIFMGGKTVVKDGLQGVVVNAEVPRGRARCGVAEKTQGCVLYIMNPQRQDLQGRDFYDLASQLTGRQRFVIETGNMRYSSTKIRPGDIAQINIPPLQ